MSRRLTVGMKIALSMGFIVLLILIMSVTSVVSLQNSKDDLEKLDAANERANLSNNIVTHYKNTILGIRTYVAFGDEAFAQKAEPDLNKLVELENKLLQLARPEKKGEVQAVIDTTTKYKNIVLTEYMPVARAYNAELAKGNFAGAVELKQKLAEITARVTPLATSVGNTVDGFSEANIQVANSLLKEGVASANRVIMVSLILSAILLLIGIGVSITLTNMIRRPVVEITEVANQYAVGDLRNHVNITSSDEFGDLANSLRAMNKNFVDMISNIRSSSQQLAAGSEEMAASTEEVTSTSSEVSRKMELLSSEAETGNHAMLEAAEALVQLSGLINMAQSMADSTVGNSRNTMTVAENGRSKVNESVDKMQNIRQQTEHTSEIIGELDGYSKQIGNIVDTITTIASQTNLLALNAAIEAARAGEHGRGFAVVAEEVRKLAEQSNQGAQEITALVQKVTDKTQLAVSAMHLNAVEVEQGVVTVNEAGAALDNILKAVEHTAAETKRIHEVTSEEVANSAQIVKLIDKISTIIETFAANCEEVAAASEQQSAAMETVAAAAEQTSAMANQLQGSIEKFKL